VVREALEVQSAMRFAQFATEQERTSCAGSRSGSTSSRHSPIGRFTSPNITSCTRASRSAADAPRCSDAIERTHALTAIWFCAMRQPSPPDAPPRHQPLAEAVAGTDPARAAHATREHIAVGMQRSLEVLEPYFKLRSATGHTFYRSDKKLKPLVGPAH
jgi:hypothetical protein